jgi:NADH-quinone oxidoreductase subunit C
VMKRNDLLSEIQSRFKEDIIELFDKSPHRVYIEIRPGAIIRAAAYIFKDLGARFNIASGIDTRSHIEILYHFTVEAIDLLISLRVKLDRKKPVIDSLTPVCEAANWIEREIFELLGVQFTGHPELKRLLLSDQWPEKVYPLRRDYKEWDKTAVRDRGTK